MKTVDPYKHLRQTGMETKPPRETPPTPQIVLAEDEKFDAMFKLMLSQHNYAKRLQRMAFNYSNPVDEYQPIGQTLDNSPVNIIPDYGTTVIYRSILYSLPIGTTSAVLRIGSTRNIQLYNGAATTTQQAQILQDLVIVANPNDERILTLAGAGTSDGYINLMGWAYDREGLS